MITWFLTAVLAAAAPSPVAGVVRDSSGAAIPVATVVVRDASGHAKEAVTGADGRFSIELPPEAADPVTLTVHAEGFGDETRRITGSERLRELDITLAPATLLETVTVTPARAEQTVANVAASVHVLTADDIRRSPASVADDVLRQVPTFSLFRRTSSLSSHPTSQGVSLRGIGPSGVSRTLVLLDGVPFNDPFGGWVYWTRVPLESADRIEVVDGASSSLYGNYAMGGVINIISSPATRRSAAFTSQYGNRQSPKVDFVAGGRHGTLGALVDGSWFRTDGFPIVIGNERGLIDNNATVKYENINAKVDYAPSDRARAFLRAGYFSENRGNGKILEVNDTRWTSVSGGVRLRLPDDSSLEATTSGDFEQFHSTFLAVTAPSATIAARSIVRLTTDQQVPTHAATGAVQWSRAMGRANAFSTGADWRWVDGDSREDAYSAAPGAVVPPIQSAVLTLKRVSGGTQQNAGAFAQDILTVSRLAVTFSARVDRWRNYNAHNLETNVPSGTPTANSKQLPDTSKAVVTPRVGAVYHVTDRVSVWGSVGSGFRAPTLNELYRQFRVGTVLTLANELLGPEQLIGSEAGATLAAGRHLTIRSTWYDNRMKNPVSNVTLTTAGANVTQQRQNLGRSRIRGLQSDVEYRASAWRFSGGYLFNDAKVTEFAANPALDGKFLPQVPRHRGSLRASYDSHGSSASLGLQFIGTQFDDDQNTRTVPGRTDAGLPGYTVADAMLSHAFTGHASAFFGIQNLFGQEYIVGTLPTTIGSPRLFEIGARVRFAGR